MNPTSIRRALYGTLAGDSTLDNLLADPPNGWAHSIYFGYAPDNANWPFVLFNKQAEVPTYANATKPAFESDVWLFKAVDKNTTADAAEAVQARVDALLQDANLSIAGGDTVMWLRRQSDVSYHEDADGVTYVHSGALYRLVYEPA